MQIFTPNTVINSVDVNANFDDLLNGLNECPYKFSVYASGTTALTSGAVTTVALAGEVFDPGEDFASNAYTVPVTGYYMFSGGVRLTHGATAGYDFASIYVDDAEKKRGNQIYIDAGAKNTDLQVGGLIYLTAGQVVTMRAYTDGSNGTVVANAPFTYFMGHLLSV
jgi:hypothetical protein